MIEHADKLLLQLCVAKRLLDKALAQEVFRRAQQEDRRPQQVLVEMGLMAAHTITVLEKEVERSLKPQTLAGFEIIRKLGQGGMATVYLARQLSLGREVALKIMSPQIAASPDAAERFLREARVAAAVNHPNIVSVIDVGRADGQLFMALELVTGGDAAQLAARFQGVLPEARSLEILCDCAAGLGALSEARLVHRDLKPSNIFLTKDGIAKLGDLGLARSEGGDDRLTMTGFLVGTPAFMSPEQASAAVDLDIRSDIYSLGATLYALTTGDAPFTGSSPLAIAAKALTEVAIDPRVHQPALSAASAELMLRALAKRPEDRYQTPQEFRQALLAALTGLGDGKRAATASRTTQAASAATLLTGMPATPATIAGRRSGPSTANPRSQRRRPDTKTMPLIVGAVAVIAVGLWIFNGTHTAPTGAAVAATPVAVTSDAPAVHADPVTSTPSTKATNHPPAPPPVVTAVIAQPPAQIPPKPTGRDSSTPAWAQSGGEDSYGRWADLRVGSAVQRLRWLKTGTFTCGSPPGEVTFTENENLSRVTISRGFWLADSECTQELWLAVMGANPAKHLTSLQLPVEQVSEMDVFAFNRALEKRNPGLKARLPSRAEWEYACRAGSRTRFWFGNDPLGLVKIGNVADKMFLDAYGGNLSLAAVDGFADTAPVKHFPPNPWGFYDMHGNVSEWCLGSWGSLPPAVTDPEIDERTATTGFLKGGSYASGIDSDRCAALPSIPTDARNLDVGFRFLIEADKP